MNVHSILVSMVPVATFHPLCLISFVLNFNLKYWYAYRMDTEVYFDFNIMLCVFQHHKFNKKQSFRQVGGVSSIDSRFVKNVEIRG